jgi:hypothetical protein
MYFNSFPKTSYTINGRTEEVLDIFRKVSIAKATNNTLYNEVVVTDSDTLESLAEKYYDDPKLSWIIAVINDIVNPIEEFVKSTALLQYLFETKYKGTIFYLEENIDLLPGDILISVNSSTSLDTLPENLLSTDLNTAKYCFANTYSNEFRYTRVTNISETFVAGNKIAAFRKTGNVLNLVTFKKKTNIGDAETNACVMEIKRVDEYLNSPVYMYNTSDNSILSPYQKFSTTILINDFVKLDANGTYANIADDNAFRQSILYHVIMDGQAVNNVAYKKLITDIQEKNEKYRRIKIIPREVLPSFLDTFNSLISSTNNTSRIISTKV